MTTGLLATVRLLRNAARVYETTIGDGVNVSFTLTPGFDTEKCLVQVTKAADGEVVKPKITINQTGSTEVNIDFKAGDVPTADQFRVIIVGLL